MQANGKVHEANFNAECFLVDAEDYLDARSMLYVPVVHTGKIFPIECAKERDLIYLASAYPAKRHDFRQSEIEGSEIHEKWNDIRHEARSERVAAPPSRRRADDDRISEDDGAVGEVQRALLSIAQRKYESAQRKK